MRTLLSPITRVELEWPAIPNRRADLFLPDMDLAVECQASPISIDEWESRMGDYADGGMDVLWVWDVGRVYGRKDLTRFPPPFAPADARKQQLKHFQVYGWWPESLSYSSEPEYRVPAEIRHCHDQLGIGHVLALDHGGHLRACEFLEIPARTSEWYDEDGEYQFREYTPTTLRWIHDYDPHELILARDCHIMPT